jgi:hypothetical protein
MCATRWIFLSWVNVAEQAEQGTPLHLELRREGDRGQLVIVVE